MSEEYQVIARKYRPMRFSDVVGQEVVTRTLMNAIKENRTAHAYLLVGPRGVGKTTLARIFAKALNCEHPENGEPCCKCSSCVSIANENNLDVIEIDAASRNSVEDMRNLTDEIMHMPIASKYKIYIIDEIHMLSNQAWNALLKTVEEPPKHVKFIFATTEVHKVLPTIISRCQRFDLMPIPTNLIVERLKKIANDQGIKIDDNALFALARSADGGMRDAQSLLDQMIAFFATGNQEHTITGEEVMALFGLADRRDLYDIMESILLNNVAKMVSSIHNLVQKGKNLETLFEDILITTRGVQLTQLLGDKASEILEESPDVLAKYQEFAKLTKSENVQILMEHLAPSARFLRDALNKQIFIETLLLKAMREANAIKISDLISRLNQLKNSDELKFIEQIPAISQVPLAQTLENPIEKKNELKAEVAAVSSVEVTPEPPKVELKTINDIPAEMGENLSELSEYEEVADIDILHDMGKDSVIHERVITNETLNDSMLSNDDKLQDESAIEITEMDSIPPASDNAIESQVISPVVLNGDDSNKDNPLRTSIMNNPVVKGQVLQDPNVQAIIDILGGDVTDVHIDK